MVGQVGKEARLEPGARPRVREEQRVTIEGGGEDKLWGLDGGVCGGVWGIGRERREAWGGGERREVGGNVLEKRSLSARLLSLPRVN